jgi:WbqC-like protein family
VIAPGLAADTPKLDRICAIASPNFFPWLGYFDKIRRADVHVFLDDIALSKSGSGMGSWINRVAIAIRGTAQWFGCPLRREPGIQLIRNVRIDDSQPWRRRLRRTLEINYRRKPGFERAMAILVPLLEYPTDNLAEFNINSVMRIAEVLGLECEFLHQSALPVSGTATERLVSITKAVGASTYIAGGGAAGYQRDELFPQNGLRLIHQGFEPRPYGDARRFIPGLSVIDYLMNVTPPVLPAEAGPDRQCA